MEKTSFLQNLALLGTASSGVLILIGSINTDSSDCIEMTN